MLIVRPQTSSVGGYVMKRYVLRAAVALFATAISPAPGAAAPVKLAPERSAPPLEEQAQALWRQFAKTAAALEQAMAKAQADKATQLNREQLKAMITLRLRLRELAERQSLGRDDLETILPEIETARQTARSARFSEPFGDFDQQADQISSMLRMIVKTMDKESQSVIVKYGA